MTGRSEDTLKGKMEGGLTRRAWLNYMTLGWGSLVALAGLSAAGLLRFMLPNVLYEPPTNFKVGMPEDFPEGVTAIPGRNVFIVRQGKRFHAISSICTHLRCQVSQRGGRFECPCHGSKFDLAGKVLEGAAPRPLDWYELMLAENGEVRVDTRRKVRLGTEFTLIG